MTEMKRITAPYMEEPEKATNQKIVLLAGVDDKNKIVKGDIFGFIVEADSSGVLSDYPFSASLLKDKELILDYGSGFDKGKDETPSKPLGYRYFKLLLPPEIKAGQVLTLESGNEKYLYRIATIEDPFETPKSKSTKAAKSAPVLSIADKPKK